MTRISSWKLALTALLPTLEPIPTMKTDTLMTADQEAHLARIQKTLAADLDAKYRAGQDEHGGNLWDKPGMLEAAIAEVLDLAVYLYVLRDQRDRGKYPNGRDT